MYIYLLIGLIVVLVLSLTDNFEDKMQNLDKDSAASRFGAWVGVAFAIFAWPLLVFLMFKGKGKDDER